MNKKLITLSLVTSIIITGCSTAEMQTNIAKIKTNISDNIGKISGTTIGTAGGAAIGKQVGGEKGMYIGALLGGTLGYFIGDEIDVRRNAIKDIIKKESKEQNQNIKVSFIDIKDANNTKIGQSYVVETEKSQFNSGKDKLNPYAAEMFQKIAKQYSKSGMSVMIIGHTDTDGSDEYNQKLSERRAKTIAKLFNKNGVPLEKMYYKGSGESDPLTQNNSSKNKAKNRRVEIVEVPNEDIVAQYASNKKINNALLPKEKIAMHKKNINKIGSQSDSNNNSQKKPSLENGSHANNNATPINMTGGKISEPLIAGQNNKKFKNQDIVGKKSVTGVKGKYYTSQKESKNAIGSCNNKYAYSKKSNLDIDWEMTKGSKNKLLAQIGLPQQDSIFSLVTPAVANEDLLAYYGSCLYDKVRKSGDVKKLSTGEVILAKQNYKQAPLLNGSAWGAEIDNEFLMINPVGIKRTNMQSVSCPELNIVKKGSNQPWYGTTTEIISYNGTDGLLYRIYPEDSSKIQCMDIAYPHGNPQDAKGIIYYKDKEGNIFSKNAKFFSLDKQGDKI